MSDTTFIQRLEEEQTQLKEKIEKLNNFINSEKFADIDDKQGILLLLQASIMSHYLMILHMRLSLLE